MPAKKSKAQQRAEQQRKRIVAKYFGTETKTSGFADPAALMFSE